MQTLCSLRVPTHAISYDGEPHFYDFSDEKLLGVSDAEWSNMWEEHETFQETMRRSRHADYRATPTARALGSLYLTQMHQKMRLIALERRMRSSEKTDAQAEDAKRAQTRAESK